MEIYFCAQILLFFVRHEVVILPTVRPASARDRPWPQIRTSCQYFAECLLENIGKPVFHRYDSDLYGSWMQVSSHRNCNLQQPLIRTAVYFKDAIDREGEDGQKIWVTKSTDNSTLFEFINKTMYRDDKPTRTYSLPLPFTVSN